MCGACACHAVTGRWKLRRFTPNCQGIKSNNNNNSHNNVSALIFDPLLLCLFMSFYSRAGIYLVAYVFLANFK